MVDNLPHNQCKQVPGRAKLHSTLNGILTWRGYETVTTWEECVSESRHAHLCVYMRLCECIHVSETQSVCECVMMMMMMMRYRDKSAAMLCRLVLVCQTQGNGHKPKVTAWRCTAQATAVTHNHTLTHTQSTTVFIFLFWWHTHIIRHAHFPHLTLIQTHTFSNFSDLSHSADVTAVIVLCCLSWAGWWQGGNTASHGSRLCFAQFKHSDKTTSLPIILWMSTLAQTSCDSPSPLTTKQTVSVCINASLRITEMVCNVLLGNTMNRRKKDIRYITELHTHEHKCVCYTMLILKRQLTQITKNKTK